jgi:hypothetical protein
MFALATVLGIVSNFASGMLNLPSLTGALIGMFEVLQYMTFLMFLNTELPPACDDFISTLFENTIELGALLNEFIIKLNIKNINFAFNYDLDVRISSISPFDQFLDTSQILERRNSLHAVAECCHSIFDPTRNRAPMADI